jgi:type IV secretion system protein VirB6
MSKWLGLLLSLGRRDYGVIANRAKQSHEAGRTLLLLPKIATSPLWLLAMTLFITLLLPLNAQANFGVSCTPQPKFDSTGYLTTNTAYGYLLSNIDMKTNIPDGCDQGDNILRFCIKNKTNSPVCTPVEMTAGDSMVLSDLSTNPDIGGNPLLADIPLSADIIGNNLCLQMLTSRGQLPVVCRGYGNPPDVAGPEAEVCKNLGSSCYDGRSKSQSLLSFSGITVNCVRQTLDKVFYVGNECPQLEEDIHFTYLSPFPVFQGALRAAVRAALILYVMFYGFKIVLNGEYVHLNKVALFILKFIFVVYLAVGLGTNYGQNGQPTQHNGMTETVLPFLLQITSDFTELVFLSGGSQGLCEYDASKYQNGYEFYRVWDAIDCRIGYYFGLQLLYNIGNMLGLTESGTGPSGSNSAASFGEEGGGISTLQKPGVFTFFAVMFGFFMSGNIIVLLCGMLFAIVFISVIFYFLSLYLVSMVTLYVMAYVSPIFIPMLLFERTKGYFDSWLKIVISCALQPAVAGGFIALLLTMYDSVFFGNCEYLRHDYEVSGFNFSTFEVREPSSEPEKCINSPGYKLIQYYLGQGWETRIVLFLEIIKINDFLNLAVSMVYLLIFIFIFYFILKEINTFISDLTGGPSMASVTVSPTALLEKAMSGASKLGSAIGGGMKKPPAPPKSRKGGGEASDKVSTGGGGGESSDKSSSGGGGASDKVSTGGGGGGGS